MKRLDASRRDFLRTSLTVGTIALTPAVHSWADDPESKGDTGAEGNDKLNLAIIGAGGRGRANTRGVKGENIYALCDVNEKVLTKAQSEFPDAKLFRDWREVMDDEKVDGVVISTADHHHALAAIAAMRAGKHVYCEKPLAHTVREARIMQQEYKKRQGKIATQMGTQIHATENYRRMVELVQGGAIGPVREAHVWCSRTIRPVESAVLPEQPEPEDFHWDIWVGPAAMRPYNEGYWKGGNLNWNRRWEFGNGVLGDMGSHLIDLPFWALQLKRPTTIESEGPTADEVACPPWQVITWEHAAREGNPYLAHPVKVIWYHGPVGMERRIAALQSKLGDDTDISKWSIGIAFVGDDGLLVGDYRKHLLSPSAKFTDYQRPAPSIPPSAGHYNEWITACKTGGSTLCNFDYSGALIEHNLLGNVAHRAGGKLEWNAEQMSITNNRPAEQFLTKEYRDGWEV